jgi:hypothetical protein
MIKFRLKWLVWMLPIYLFLRGNQRESHRPLRVQQPIKPHAIPEIPMEIPLEVPLEGPEGEDIVILRTFGDIGLRKRESIQRYLASGFPLVIMYDTSTPGNQSNLQDSLTYLHTLYTQQLSLARLDVFIHNLHNVRDAYPSTSFEIGYKGGWNPVTQTGDRKPLTYQGSPPMVAWYLRTLQDYSSYNLSNYMPLTYAQQIQRQTALDNFRMYQNVWIIECDTMFAGNVADFFEYYREMHSDTHLITSRLRRLPPKGWLWDKAWTHQMPQRNRWIQEDHITRYSRRFLNVLDDMLSIGVYSLGVQLPTTICASLPWCDMISMDEQHIAPAEHYAWNVRINRTLWESMLAQQVASVAQRWVHACKFDEPLPGWTPPNVADVYNQPHLLPLKPTFDFKRGLVWEETVHTPRAVLVLIPSCAFIHADFWIHLQTRKMVQYFVHELHYHVVGVNGYNLSRANPDVCLNYRHEADNKDVPFIQQSIQNWRLERKLDHLPLFAYGISAGGAIVSMTSQQNVHMTPWMAAIFHINFGAPTAISSNHPPTLFSTMSRDFYATTSRVAESRSRLEEVGVQSKVYNDDRQVCISNLSEGGGDELSSWYPAVSPTMSRDYLNFICKEAPEICNSSCTNGWLFQHAAYEKRTGLWTRFVRGGKFDDEMRQFYRHVASIDMLAWKSTNEEVEPLSAWFVSKGYWQCTASTCQAHHPVALDDWTDLLQQHPTLMMDVVRQYYSHHVGRLAVQLLMFQHCAVTDGLREVWGDWFERFL